MHFVNLSACSSIKASKTMETHDGKRCQIDLTFRDAQPFFVEMCKVRYDCRKTTL